MKKRLTLQDIADMTGTSKSTVSRVLTGKGYVSEPVRAQILRTMEEQGYEPQKSRKSKNVNDMVMVIASQLDSEVQATLANAIRRTLGVNGKKTAIVSVGFGSPELYEYLKYARQREFAGLILLGALETEELRESMEDLPFPAVFLNQSVKGIAASKVEMEDYEAAYSATSYLLACHHRKIAFLNGYANAAAVADRERGYWDAMADAGILERDIVIAYKDFSEKGGREFADEICQGKADCTAVIAANDLLTLGLLLRLQELGKRVPEDISIIGFDNTLATRVCYPPVTVVDYDFAAMGEALARLLLEKIESPFSEERTVLFASEIVKRQSVAKPDSLQAEEKGDTDCLSYHGGLDKESSSDGAGAHMASDDAADGADG